MRLAVVALGLAALALVAIVVWIRRGRGTASVRLVFQSPGNMREPRYCSTVTIWADGRVQHSGGPRLSR